MTNYVTDQSFDNDLLSKSYSEGIRKITGTKSSCFDFEISEKVLEVRKRDWSNFFEKYLEQMSDEIELKVDCLELEINNEEYNNKHRVPICIHKPSALIQYWINTGDQPYNAPFNEDDLSDSGSSLSERSIRILSHSLAVIEANKPIKRKQKSDSSYSSIDTKEYISSNANVTKKADTVAIIQNAKYDNAVISENVLINNTEDTYNNRLECTKPLKSHIIRNNNSNDDAQCPNAISCFIPVKHATSKTNIQTSTDAISSNILQRTPENLFLVNAMSTSQQFDRSKEAVSDVRNANSLNLKKISERHTTFDTPQVLANNTGIENITKNMSFTLSSRKRLYTGTSSPVDLIAPERCNMNRLSEINQYLHPALNSPYIVEGKTSLINKDKNKYSSLKNKKDLAFNKGRTKKRKRTAAFNKKITNIGDKVIIANDSKISGSTQNFSRDLSDSDNILYKRDNDTAFTECNNVITSCTRNTITEHNLLSLNLNPIVLLERIPEFVLPSTLKQHESARHEQCTGRSNTNNSNKLYSGRIEYLESDTVNSDDSTILICPSKRKIESDEHLSNYSFNQTSSSENYSFSSSAEKKDRLSNLKDIAINKVAKVVLEPLPLLINKSCENLTVDAEMFNKNDTIHETKILNKSDIRSPNLDYTRKRDNVKLQEVKIILVPIDTSFKRGNNPVNVSSDKKRMLRRKGVDNNEKKSIIETKVSPKNIKSSTLRNSYRLSRDTNFTKKSDELNCTTTSSVSFFDELELKSIAQRKNGNKRVESKDKKYSIMNSIVLPNEENFVQLIKKNAHKNSRNVTDGNVLDQTSTVENTFCNKAESFNNNKNKNIGTDSPRKVKSIKDKNRRSKRKSLNNSITSTSVHKKTEFVILSSESDNSSITEKLDKQKKQSSLLSCSKNTNNNIKRRSSRNIKRDTTNHKNNNNMLCQTRIFNTDSSSSEESTTDTTVAFKASKPSIRNTVYHNRSNKKTCFNNPIKRHIKLSVLSSSSDENNKVAKHKYNLATKSRESVTSKKEKNERKGQNKEKFNYHIKSDTSNNTINIITESIFSFSSIDNISKICTLKEDNAIINTSNKKDNLDSSSESEHTSVQCTTSVSVKNNVKSPRFLRFQKRNLIDSDSSESL